MAPPSWAVSWRYLGAQLAGVWVAFWVKTLLVMTGGCAVDEDAAAGGADLAVLDVEAVYAGGGRGGGVAAVAEVAAAEVLEVVAAVVEMRTRPSLRASRMVGWASMSRVQVVGAKPP